MPNLDIFAKKIGWKTEKNLVTLASFHKALFLLMSSWVRFSRNLRYPRLSETNKTDVLVKHTQNLCRVIHCLVHQHFHVNEPGIHVPGHPVGNHSGKSDERFGTISQRLEVPLSPAVLTSKTSARCSSFRLFVLGDLKIQY